MAEPKDVSKRHFYISLVKSCVRIAAGMVLIAGNYVAAGSLLIVAEVLQYFSNKIVAEVLGIVEEL